MMFRKTSKIYHQTQLKQQEHMPKPPSQINPMMSFSPNYLRFQAARQVKHKDVVAPPAPTIQDPTKVKKMRWGEPTWFAFHTLAQKVKEDAFPLIRLELLNMINMICNNLPCPQCAKHATQHMNSINFNSIQTKSQLQIMLFNFHNDVNRRKAFPIFKYEDLEPKYSKANLIPVLQNFMRFFEDKTGSFRLIADEMQRARLCNHIRTWFQHNLHHFDM